VSPLFDIAPVLSFAVDTFDIKANKDKTLLIKDVVGDDKRLEKSNDIVNQTTENYIKTVVETARGLPQTNLTLKKAILCPKQSWYRTVTKKFAYTMKKESRARESTG
jgi:hypothetical protein